ncbi:hypothetical protein J4760_04095 [Salinicoccus sp. ID82-1]|uniref:phage minor capsid protein n=1 Tax=Salinicoccus sp. ID82-1 TaxID=2820269 RepID=UPI001F3E95F8|nr:phage minor capsid protein [Salinicoccus sp. ID82-1]MCG1009233.1 hypothetical protein [Salinicoccus sp. ID82-1]
MTIENLDQVTAELRSHIITLIQSHDLTKDREARRVASAIEDAFRRLHVRMEEVIPQALLVEYYNGMESAQFNISGDQIRFIAENGKITERFKTQIHLNAVSEVVNDTMSDLLAAYRTAEANTLSTIKRTVSSVKEELTAGAVTGAARKQVTQRVSDAFLKDGMTSFITKDGKKLPLDFYAATVTATKSRQASVNGHINRYTEEGTDLVEITGNNPTCETCARYQGMVFSLSGKTPGYPKYPADLLPLHPHCQCGLLPVPIQYMSSNEIKAMQDRNTEFAPADDRRSDYEKSRYESMMAEKRQENAEKKMYARMQALLGADAPKDLGAFRRMKRANTLKYQELYSNYLSATHSVL